MCHTGNANRQQYFLLQYEYKATTKTTSLVHEEATNKVLENIMSLKRIMLKYKHKKVTSSLKIIIR